MSTRSRQVERQGCLNSLLAGSALLTKCRLGHEAHRVLLTSRASQGGSLRSQDRLLRVARTIADLRASDSVSADDVLEAGTLRHALS